ncbi:MAG: hypothetical protein AB7P99_15460 [Vicinamibacterales bacterium]
MNTPAAAVLATLDPEILERLRKPTLFTDDLACVLACSRDTIERRRKNKTLPRGIVELEPIDGRPRFATASVVRYLHLEDVVR